MNLSVQIALAWSKIQKGIEQEAEGRALWIEGTIQLIQILDKARNEIPSDTAFNDWLQRHGHANLIRREDRSGLLNMAEHLDLTCWFLEDTNARSYRYIWYDQISPYLKEWNARLRIPAQPQSSHNEDTTEPQLAEPPKTTRRPKKPKKTKAEQIEDYNKATGFEFRWGEPVRKELGVMPDDIREQYEKCIREASIQLDMIFQLNLYANQMHPEFRLFLASALRYIATRFTRHAKELVGDLRKVNQKDFCGVEIPIRLN